MGWIPSLRRPHGSGRLAALALALAVALWLSAPSDLRADTASASQTVRVRVIAGLGWNTHGRCATRAAAAHCAHGSGRWHLSMSTRSPTRPATVTLASQP